MDPYDVLGLTATASDDELEARYRVLLRRHHPDMHQGEGPQGVAQAEYATRLLNQAMTQIRRERARDGVAGTSPHNRAYARPRATPSPGASDPGPAAGDPAPAGDPRRATGPAADGPWWAGPQKAGSPCPFCGLHLGDYASYEQHLDEAHRVRLEVTRRRRIPITIGRGVADALRVAAILVSAVALLWLSLRVQLNVIVWFLLWLGIVALFLPSLLLRPRQRRRR